MRKLQLVPLFLALGCSLVSSNDSTPPPVKSGPVAIQLSMSRASMIQTEFEIFKTFGSKLYFECGELKHGRPIIKDHGFVELGTGEVMQIAQQIISKLDQGKMKVEPPGTATNLFDPGKFVLQLGKQKIETSVDSVADSGEGPAKQLKELAQALRSRVAKPICGNQKFYGLSGLIVGNIS